mmetsp:Transcript_16405/g.36213  ORF Transcript_16405/g.36213 Transcript_16405/m.36213 type:complete len:122 (+) Transcript_16405:48-413(+)
MIMIARKVDAFPVGRLYFNPSMHDEFTEPVIVSLFARAHTDWGATGWSDPVFSLHFFFSLDSVLLSELNGHQLNGHPFGSQALSVTNEGTFLASIHTYQVARTRLSPETNQELQKIPVQSI